MSVDAREALRTLKALARERGGWLLAAEYVDAETPLRWRCRHRHEWDATPSSIKWGSWCGVCAGVAPGSLEEYQAIARARGGECLSRRYVNYTTPLRWRCEAGHTWSGPPGPIKRGRWCPTCGGTRKLTIRDMRRVAKQRRGQCLSTQYDGLNGTRLQWRCAEGHEWEATGASVWTGGAWCPKCAGAAKPVLADMKRWARERGGECLADAYERGDAPMLWRCAERHRWAAPWNRIHGGSWCPECSKIARRRPKPRKTLADMQAIARARGGACLSTEYVNSVTKLRWRCEQRHEWEAVQSSVAAGKWCPHCAGVARGSIEELHAVAKKRRGVCLASEYLGVDAKYRWRCSKGHEWEAAAKSVKRGTWCLECGGRAKLTIEEMHRMAAARDGACLSDTYAGNQTHLRWRCDRGHVWDAVPMSIRAGTWCPECAIDARMARTAERRRPR